MNPEDQNSPKPAPGMDVTPVQSAEVQSPAPEQPTVPVESPVVADNEHQNIQAVAEPPAQESSEPEPQETEEPAPKESLAAEKKSHTGTRMPVLPILIAVTFAMSLAIVAVVAFVQRQDETKTPVSTTETKQKTETTQTNEVTESDIDETTKALDQELESMNDDQDLPESELGDESLGL